MTALLAESFWMHPAVVGVIIGLPAAAIAILGYRRSMRADAVAVQAGIYSESRQGVEQVIEGLNALVDRLQEDNRVLRENVRELNKKVAAVLERCEGLKQQIVDLNSRIP